MAVCSTLGNSGKPQNLSDEVTFVSDEAQV